VILAAGGFVHDRGMIATFAPAYLPGTPLGTLGDDGSGIRMGTEVGGVTDRMERVTAWRFINPPISFTSGVLVGPSGARVCNEEVYGALMGRRMVEDHEGVSWLILDRALWRRAHGELGPSKANWFQSVPALVNLWWNRHRAIGVEALARKMGVDSARLRDTLEAYNRGALSGVDALGKSEDACRELRLDGPLYAIDCSLGSRLFTCATLTLGGLRVDESSGAVLDEGGASIPGLYAAGRTAVGVTSEGYVSGLSIADAVFSGRRAARSASQSALVSLDHEQTLDPAEGVWTTEAD
jgi:3-oxo-5alpha-steroid 4-dehydrogenase